MKARLRDDCFALPPGVEWTPVDDALARLRDGLTPVVGTETVALAEADGRYLAEALTATRANPPHANAAVDGWALRFDDLAGDPARLPIQRGRSAAGSPFEGRLAEGRALRILTGADVPEGADTVVLQEDAEEAEGTLTLRPPRRAGANVRPRGEDVEMGERVAEPPRRLRPADLARLAAAGIAGVPVHAPLRVAVLSTGDELAEPGRPGGIADANRPALSALARRWGHRVVDLGIATDDAGAVRAALDRGADGAHAIVTSGGASAGDEDHVSALLRREGTVATWRIAVKPGRPLILGFWRGVPVFGLPGNPVAAVVCALIFLRPALSRLAGGPWVEPRALTLEAAFDKTKKAGRREYLRGRRLDGGRVEPFGSEGSGLTGSLAWADGLIVLPEPALTIAEGDLVAFLPYEAFDAA